MLHNSASSISQPFVPGRRSWFPHPAVLPAVAAALLASVVTASPADQPTCPAGDAGTVRVLYQEIATEGAPADLARPEGKTRWDLTGARAVRESVRTSCVVGASAIVRDEQTTARKTTEFVDRTGADAAARWVFPQRFKDRLRMATRERLDLEVRGAEGTENWLVDAEIIGIGWVHLAAGPREVVLQIGDVHRQVDGVDSVERFYRWIDPTAGVVAEASGPVATGAESSFLIDSAAAASEAPSGAADLKIYVDQIDRNTFQDIAYGWDKGSGTLVSSLTPEHYNTIGELIAANAWDFSGNNSGVEVAATTVPINSSETCNYSRCGYTMSGAKLERRDRDFTNVTPDKYNTVRQRENRAGDSVLWLRAAAQHEGKTGGFGSGESRICYVSDGSGTRTPVPEWLFSHPDAQGFYMQAGDTWTGGPFNCEQNLFNQTCGAAQLFDKIYSKACGSHTGKHTGEVLKGGVVTLPSGHTFNVLLTRTMADYCVYSEMFCLLKVDEVRTVVYLWTAPYIGTVARVQSVQNAADATSFTSLEETDFKFGLFPPRTITVTGATDSTISLSWDPGNDTHRVSGYKIYWDKDSGSATPYAFNSVDNAGQVSFSGTTATISGLTSGTTYYLTVTTLSDYRDPSTNVTTRYESLLYPTQVSGDPSYVYPVEVQSATTCTPTHEVGGVRVNKSGGQIQICWNALTSESCLAGYRVLGSDTPSSASSFQPIADVDASSLCWTGSPAQSYFLVVARGTGGTGPWGHYGR